MSTPTIRTLLQPGDLTYLLSSHADFYCREYHYSELFEYFLAKAITELYEVYHPDRSRIWMVELGKKRVGCLVLQDRGEDAQLRFFFLDAEVRGQGIGRRLLNDFIALAGARNYRRIYFWTTDEQIAAGNLYRSAGFEVVQEQVSDTFGRKTLEQRYEMTLTGLPSATT